jgi:hypothetical protein
MSKKIITKEHDTEERYVAFYFVEGFWAESKPDYSKFGSQYWITPGFSKLMEEQVIKVSDGDRSIIVSRDGMIMYTDPGLANLPEPQNEPFQRIEKYTEILNGIFFVIASVITEQTKMKSFQYFEITHNDIVPISYNSNGFSSMGLPQKSMQLAQVNKRFLSNAPANSVDSLDSWIDQFPRPVLSKELLVDAINIYFQATKDSKNIRLLARSNKAAAEFEGTSFSDSVLIAWTEIETNLYEKLTAFMLEEGSKRFNSDRRDFLGKEFTASEIIELLEASGVITIEEYKALNIIRKNRNKIIHEGKTASFKQAGEALKFLEKVISDKTGESIVLNTGVSMQMF